jgi:hypothetical protein
MHPKEQYSGVEQHDITIWVVSPPQDVGIEACLGQASALAANLECEEAAMVH